MFADMNACQILDQLNAGQGFERGRNISKRNECTASKYEYGANGLALDPVQGLAEFRQTDPGASEITINGRKALEVFGEIGGCAIAVEVGPHARALINVNMASPRNNPQACPDARSLAERVEPLLPRVPA
ncbi:DUF3558 domain-containing protein [Amycolatopsis methanolica]|uniref:DUF3558 domain-containing protein n=1 Tax=Amycolatopsis methanolica TaxID=1814 RepID=UPI0034128CB1